MKVLTAVLVAAFFILSMGVVSADLVPVDIDGQVVYYDPDTDTEDDVRAAVAKFGLPPAPPSDDVFEKVSVQGDYSDGDSIADMNRVKKYKEFAASLPF